MSDSSEEFDSLLAESQSYQGGLGAVAWAVLEMLRRGRMHEQDLQKIYDQMVATFARAEDDECDLVVRVLEARLAADKDPETGRWY